MSQCPDGEKGEKWSTIATQLVQVESILPHSGVTKQRALESIVYITLDVDLCVFECDLQ